MKRFNRHILLGGIQILILSLIGCTVIEFTSHWRDREIAVDGDQEDWQGKITVSKDKNVALGFMNDESKLYVTLSSSDRSIMMQVMRLGFTIWFDPKGGKKEVFGVRYPIGIAGMGTRTIGDRVGAREGMPEMEEQIRSLEESQIWIEILGPGKDEIARFSVMDSTGIQVASGISSYGRFIYELKIPLGPSPDSPYAVNTSPGETVGIGFETGEIDLAAMRSQQAGSGMRGGGMRGGGRGPSGMPGVGQGRHMPEQFRYWIRVTLASEK